MQMQNDPADIMKKITRHVVSIDNEGTSITLTREPAACVQRGLSLRARASYTNGRHNFIYYHICRYASSALRASFDRARIDKKQIRENNRVKRNHAVAKIIAEIPV